METRVIRIGSSLGIVIPKTVIKESNFSAGTVLDISSKNGTITIKKKSKVRDGWEKAFAAYAEEGEDKMLLPDFIDSETIEMI